VLIYSTGEYAMRSPVTSAALAAAFGLIPVAAGYAPASAQDFSITNPEEPANAGRRDLMRQLQAWWDVHGYYPRHASNNDEAGTVAVQLVIDRDGRITSVNVMGGSGSHALDVAATTAFLGGFVRPFPPGMPEAVIDLSLHYVLTHQQDQAVAVSNTPTPVKRPFTITNDPLKSTILETMLQRACNGTVVKEGIRNHPEYGGSYAAQAIFFRKPDGTPWVKFYESGFPVLSAVTEVGKMVQWTGREEHLVRGVSQYTQYTVWPESDNKLSGYLNILSPFRDPDAYDPLNHGGTVELTCATEIVPQVQWSAWSVTPGKPPPGDPP
jgi:TonB family protein